MNDTTTGQVPAEPVPAALDATLAPEAAPAPDAEPVPGATPTPEAAPPEPAEDGVAKTARERIIDHFADSDDPDQTVQQIMAGTGLNRNLADSTLSRAVDAGLIERVGQAL
jgi:hypothetical protein